MHTERAISSIKERGVQGKEAVRGFFSDKKAAAKQRVADRIAHYKEAASKVVPSKDTLKAIGAVVVTPVVAAALVPAAAGYVAYRGVKAAGEVAGKGKEAVKSTYSQHKVSAETRKLERQTKRQERKTNLAAATAAQQQAKEARKASMRQETERQRDVRQTRREDSLKASAQIKADKRQARDDKNQQRLKEANERMARHEAQEAARKKAKAQGKADKAFGQSVKKAHVAAIHEDKARSIN